MASSDAPYVLSGGVQKPATDDREYKYVQLPNKLKVVLVSDSKANKAGAAMCVNVGHFSDPDELPGLAHFLEHMLFLGTEKYPDENSYSAYLSAHGGGSNAYTQTEHTNYHFDVQAAHLEEALDRFAQFFIAPLFTPSATERELMAVDSEHSKNVQSDMWRFYQLDKSTSAESHPYHKFGTGNAATLSTNPKANGVDVRAGLLDFHAKWYSANLMTLCVSGRESLDVLEEWVVSKFSGVKNTDQAPPVVETHPYEAPHLGIQQWVVPVQDSHNVAIGWPLPEQITKYRSKPATYLSHLLGHEGAGSVLSLLKSKGLGLDLMAGTMTSESGFSFFGVEVEMPPDALPRVDEVVSTVFAYLRMLKEHGPLEWIHREMADVANSSFRFSTKQPPVRHTTSIAQNLQSHAPEHAMSGPRLHWDFAPDEISELLALMTPENMRMRVVSQTLEDKCTMAEEWYKTAYFQERISEDRKKAWMTGDIDPALHLPEPNPFIATDFALRHATAPNTPDAEVPDLDDAATPDIVRSLAEKHTTIPSLVRDDDHALVFFSPDTKFGQPKLDCNMTLVCPVAYDSPRSAVLSDLYSQLIKEQLNELSYHASIANLSYDVRLSNTGFSLYLTGFNHKLHILAEKVAAVLPAPEFTDEQFELFRGRTERTYKNAAMQQPYVHSVMGVEAILNTPRYLSTDKLADVATVTAAELRAFVPHLLGQVFVRAVVYGNATADEARGVVDAVVDAVGARPLPLTLRHVNRVGALPYGMSFRYWIPAPNPAELNSGIETMFQIGPQNTQANALVDLLGHMLKEPFFDSLRTKQALGYIAFAGTRLNADVNGIRFLFQSDKVSSDELDRRIEVFIESFRTILAEMPAEDFKMNVKAVLMQKLAAPKKPSDVSTRLANELSSGTLNFRRTIQETQALLKVTQKDLQEFFDEYVAKGAPRRRKLTCLVEAGAEAVAAAAEKGAAAGEGGATGGEEEAKEEGDASGARDGVKGPLLPQALSVHVANTVGHHPPSSTTKLREDVAGALAGLWDGDAGDDAPVVDILDREAFRLSLSQHPQLFASNLMALRAAASKL